MFQFSQAFTSEEVAKWLKRETGLEAVPPYTACGIARDGKLYGCWVWSEHTGHNIEVSIYAPGCLTRRILREGFEYAFNQLKVTRITSRIPLLDNKLNRIVSKAGWRMEGILRSFYGPGIDAVIYGMLKNECRWVKVSGGPYDTNAVLHAPVESPHAEKVGAPPPTANIDRKSQIA